MPPLQLIFPVGHREALEVLPGREVQPWDGAMWLTGESSGLQPDESVPAEVWKAGGLVVQLHRLHNQYTREWQDAIMRASRLRLQAQMYDEGKAANLAAADAEDARAREIEKHLRDLRNTMRTLGLTVLPDPRPVLEAEDNS